MGRRRTCEAIIREPCDPGKEPNSYIGQITAQIRVHFPPTVTKHQVLFALVRAFGNVALQLDREFTDEP